MTVFAAQREDGQFLTLIAGNNSAVVCYTSFVDALDVAMQRGLHVFRTTTDRLNFALLHLDGKTQPNARA